MSDLYSRLEKIAGPAVRHLPRQWMPTWRGDDVSFDDVEPGRLFAGGAFAVAALLAAALGRARCRCQPWRLGAGGAR